ncbi:hypothetical protein HZP25_15650 [Elizabethkingia anophelis]|nr:hypothetical protein [Elizabethkingia anophelis]
MSCIQLDGSHTPVKRGGESFGYQGRKKCKTTIMLFVCNNQGIPIAFSQPIAGNHHDTFKLEQLMGEILKDIKNSNIRTDGLFLNADAGLTPTSSWIIVLAMMYLLILTSISETEKYLKESIFLITLYIKEDLLLNVQMHG